jgi:hypothetical protein
LEHPLNSLQTIVTDTDIAAGIRERGYTIVPGDSFRLGSDEKAALQELIAQYDDLPEDQYLVDGGSYRRRRHARYSVSGADLSVARIEDGAYFQSAAVNQFAGGVHRSFAPLKESSDGNMFLRNLLQYNVSCFDPGRSSSWVADVHLVRIQVGRSEVGLPSPEGIHRDGFDFIALHLMGRQNVLGGRSVICDPARNVLRTPMLRAPLDSLYADDTRILHGNEPVSLDPAGEAGRGCRDMLLTSYARSDGR